MPRWSPLKFYVTQLANDLLRYNKHQLQYYGYFTDNAPQKGWVLENRGCRWLTKAQLYSHDSKPTNTTLSQTISSLPMTNRNLEDKLL